MEDGVTQDSVVRWMAQSAELKKRFNYESTCGSTTAVNPTPAAASTAPAPALNPVALNTPGAFQANITSLAEGKQVIPGFSVCTVRTRNDASTTNAFAAVQVESYPQGHILQGIDVTPGGTESLTFLTPDGFHSGELNVFYHDNMTLASATVTCANRANPVFSQLERPRSALSLSSST